MGYIDESWRVTEAGKSRLLSEQQQQQIQEFSYEASQTIGADINNAAAQAELLRTEQLSLQHDSQLAFYAQAKAQQIDNLQASLQSTIHNQAAKLAAIEQKQPAWLRGRQARTAWQNQIAKARLAQLGKPFRKGGGGRPRCRPLRGFPARRARRS